MSSVLFPILRESVRLFLFEIKERTSSFLKVILDKIALRSELVLKRKDKYDCCRIEREDLQSQA